jgi:Tfp pilus assembly protein PilO
MYSVLIIIGIVLCYWFLIKPKWGEYRDAKQSLSVSQKNLQKLEGEKEQFQRLLAELKESSTEVALLDEAIPLDHRITKIELLLDNLAGSAGMQVAGMTVDQIDPTPMAGNKTVLANQYGATRKVVISHVSMSLTGTLEQFKGFLQLVESNGRIIDIDNITAAAESDGTLSYKLKLKAYSLAP